MDPLLQVDTQKEIESEERKKDRQSRRESLVWLPFLCRSRGVASLWILNFKGWAFLNPGFALVVEPGG